MREILKIVNFYVRDRQMGHVLRRSLLSKSASDIGNGTWDAEVWLNTQTFLESSFGTGREIVG